MSGDVPPPITPETSGPRLEEREDIKQHRVEELVQARKNVSLVKAETDQKRVRDPRFTRGDANTEYLSALQSLVLELEQLYERLGICEQYFTDEGDPLAVLDRPHLDVSDVIDDRPECYHRGGQPPIANPEVLEPERLDVIWSLRGLLRFQDARIPYRVTLDVVGGDNIVYRGETVISRRVLNRAHRWALDFWEQAGLSIDEQDNGKYGKVGGQDKYGND